MRSPDWGYCRSPLPPQSGRCACFDQTQADVGLANDGALRQVLHDYFAWATTTTMSHYHQSAADVPIGLSIPHWSWDGLKV
jgi:hemoglobin